MVNVGHQSNGRVNEPTHHIALKEVDGSNETGFLCVGADEGQQVIPDISVIPYPGQATQIRTGRAKHGDKVPPFLDVSLADFGGGMGMLHRDEDKSRYLDGYMVATEQPGRTLLQGRPVYTTGLRDFNEYQPANTVTMSWRNVYSGTNEDTEITFLTEAAYNADKVRLYLRKIGSPTGNVTVTLRLNDNTVQKTITLDASNLSQHSPYWVEFDWTGTEALLNATNYKININYAGGDATNYIQLWYDTTNSKFPYRVLDDTNDFDFLTVEYKDAFYGITQPFDRAVSKLYILGDRGAADDNTGALTTLVDATKTWTTNEWAGSVVKILGDSKEEQPWRTISSNNGTTLTLSETWNTVHTTNTEYVILGSEWKLKQTLSSYAYSVTTVSDKMFIGFGYPSGTDQYTRRYREFNNNGTWTEDLETEANSAAGAIQMLGVTEEFKWRYPSAITGELWVYTLRDDTWSNLMKLQVPYKDISNSNVVGVFCTNDRAWIDTTYANVTYDVKANRSQVSIADGFGTGKVAHWKFDSSVDTRVGASLLIRFKISAGYVNDGDLQLILADSGGNEDTYNINPDATVDGGTTGLQSRYIYLDTPGTETADPSDITDIYLNVAVDQGAATFYLYGPIYLCHDRNDYGDRWQDFPQGTICNGMELYAGGAGQPVENPWLLCNTGAYYIEGSSLNKIPLGELEEFAHYRSGQGHVVHDVHLYWNVGPTIQRYFAGQLDNIGPDVDYGLPANRRGIPCTMAGYPGMMLAGFDCGSSGYSHVMYRRNHGWHELYRSPIVGNRIKNIHVLGRSDKVDELYISEGADVFYVPLSLNSETETSFDYTYHGHIQTSRVYTTTRETKKFFKSLELIQEAHDDADSTPNTNLRVYYKTSSVSTWTLIDDYTTIPNEENNIGTYNIGGTWIQFLIEFEAQEAGYSPILVAAVLDATERLVVKNTYNYTLMVREDEDDNLDGSVETVLGSTKIAQLETWAKQELPLILRSNSIFEDNKYVFIEPTRARMSSQEIDGDGKEIRTYKLSLLEVD